MKSGLNICLLVLGLIATPSSYALAASPVDSVLKAETDFDDYTHTHGYRHGFFAYSASDALAFDPAPSHIHGDLAADLAKDPSESDAPSNLRWWPLRAAISRSGDLAYDLGGWISGDSQVCGSKQKGYSACGWFLTVWQQQADGKWKWIADGSAGRQAVEGAPPPRVEQVQIEAPTTAQSDTAAKASEEIIALEMSLNSKVANAPAIKAYLGIINIRAIIADDGSEPAQSFDAFPTALAARPTGLVWKNDGVTVSAAGDLAYTRGHSETLTGTAKGYYIRIWRKDTYEGLSPIPSHTTWSLAADIYHATH